MLPEVDPAGPNPVALADPGLTQLRGHGAPLVGHSLLEDAAGGILAMTASGGLKIAAGNGAPMTSFVRTSCECDCRTATPGRWSFYSCGNGSGRLKSSLTMYLR